MTEDKFEQKLMTRLSKGTRIDTTSCVLTEILSDYRAFKAEKPTAPASLVEVIEDICDLNDDVAKHMDITITGEPTVKVSYLKEMVEKAIPVPSDKPAKDLQGQHAQMVALAKAHGLDIAADWAVKMSGKTFSEEKSTAPASLVERLNKWSEGCYGYTDNPSKCPAMDEFEKIIREAESKARQYLMGLQDKEGR